MRKIEWTLSMGLVGCRRTGVIEVEDDLTDDEIDEWVSDEVHQIIEWNWRDSD